MLNESENAGDIGNLLSYKRIQLQYLERASKCIEKYLPRCLPSGDIDTDSWIKEATGQVAAAIREKKKWILTTKKDTSIYFIRSISLTLLSFIQDDWDSLERMEKHKRSIPNIRLLVANFALKTLRIIVLLGLPIVGFWMFQKFPLAIPDTVRGYVFVGLFLWEMFTLIIVIDPNLNAKVSVIKDLTSLLR
jgi:hypothetical protein